jgi:hypothetical protein
MKSLAIATILILGLIAPAKSSANGWSFNVGVHNPPGSLVGANFLHFWSHLALEMGVGWLDASSSNRNGTTGNGTANLAVAGDINLKYLFLDRVFRPYIQGGFGAATVTTVGDNTGASAGVGGGFFGGGIFICGQKVYGYGSINSAGGLNTFLQGGLGFYF